MTKQDTKTDKKNATYCTSYCNHPHDLKDGKPIAHNCLILKPEALALEREGKFSEILNMVGGMVKEPRVEMRRGKALPR